MHTCIHTWMYMYTHIYIYIYTHTHSGLLLFIHPVWASWIFGCWFHALNRSHILSTFPHHPRMGTTILSLAALSAGDHTGSQSDCSELLSFVLWKHRPLRLHGWHKDHRIQGLMTLHSVCMCVCVPLRSGRAQSCSSITTPSSTGNMGVMSNRSKTTGWKREGKKTLVHVLHNCHNIVLVLQ